LTRLRGSCLLELIRRCFIIYKKGVTKRRGCFFRAATQKTLLEIATGIDNPLPGRLSWVNTPLSPPHTNAT